MAKMKGSRLETEVDKCRGECNWSRLSDLLNSVRAKNSGIEKLAGLIEGELMLESFLERQKNTNGHLKPKLHLGDFLRTTEGMLKTAIASNREKPPVLMESYILLAKVHYFSCSFQQALDDLEKSQLDMAKTQFVTLRSLKLAAEGYAIKGFASERLMLQDPAKDISRKRLMGFFEAAVELTISYITEFEKSVGTTTRSSLPTSSKFGSSQLGDLLEGAMERAPFLLLKRSVVERKPDEEGVELYRKIMTELSDKSVVEQTQQRLCRQLAEILLRGSIESGLAVRNGSRAINKKSEILNFYTGSNKNYYSPASRVEEIVLLLLISEVIASRAMRSSTYEGDTWQQKRLVHNLKQVHNLLSLVLSHLRQHSLLSVLMDKAVQFVGTDHYIWQQFGLALACTGRIPRAIKTLKQAANLNNAEVSPEQKLIEYMQVAKLEIEASGDPETVISMSNKALEKCGNDALAGRCMLLYALGFSMKTRLESSFDKRRELLRESVENFEKARTCDTSDDLTQLFTALEYAEMRNLQKARDVCEEAIERNPYNVSAQMLMALLFTAKHDYKSAMRLVLKAIVNFPNHYGLMVLRLRLESKFGRVDRAMKTSRNLLRFWQKMPEFVVDDDLGANGYYTSNVENAHLRAQHEHNGGNKSQTLISSRDALAPVTPIFTAPLGIPSNALTVHNMNNSVNDVSELAMNTIATRLSEFGGATSTASESIGFGTSSSLAWSAINTFRSRANIWVELAELLIETNHLQDIQVCVEEACTLFPNSYHATYLKGRVFMIQAEKVTDQVLKRNLYSDARACFLAALAVHPTHIPSFQHLGQIYLYENNLKMAEKTLRDAVSIDPLREDLWQHLGRVFSEQGILEEAQKCFETASGIDSTNPIMPFDVIPRLLKSTF